MATIEEHIIALLREHLRNLPPNHSIKSDDHLTNDLEMDDFDALALFASLDLDFALPALSSDDLFYTVHTVGDLIQYIKMWGTEQT